MHNYSKVKPNLIFFILGPLILIIGVVFMITFFLETNPCCFRIPSQRRSMQKMFMTSVMLL